MAKLRSFIAVVALLSAGLAVTPTVAHADPPPPSSPTFDTPGEHTYTVPDGVTQLTVTAVGGQGGGDAGGRGARVRTVLNVTPGEVLTAIVGGDGVAGSTSGGGAAATGGGGAGGMAKGCAYIRTPSDPTPICIDVPGNGGASGGGASEVRSSSGTRLVVAGGGGGEGGEALATDPVPAGPGGDAGAPGGRSVFYWGTGGGAGTPEGPGVGGAAYPEDRGQDGTADAGGAGGVGDTRGDGAVGETVGGGGGGGGGGGFQGAGGGSGAVALPQYPNNERYPSGGGGGGGGSYAAPGRTSAFEMSLEPTGGTGPLVRFQVGSANIVVNSRGDDTTAGDGECTLREAFANLHSVDTTAGDCTIGDEGATIQIVAQGLIELGGPLPDLPDGVDLVGPGIDLLTIRPVSGARSTEWRILTVDGTSTISGLTIAGSDSAGDLVGGLLNLGHATLRDCRFRGGHAVYGGAIEDQGDLLVQHCSFLGNLADSTGGAIQHNSLDASHTVAIEDSRFEDNHSTFEGGALWLGTTGHGDATATIERSTFEGNGSLNGDGGGAIWTGTNADSQGSVDTAVHDTAILGNDAVGDGGGLLAVTGPRSLGTVHLLVDRSEVSQNTASGNGGGVADVASGHAASVDVVNSTVWSNSSAFLGGGLDVASAGGAATTSLIQSMVYANTTGSGTGGGVAAVPSGPTTEPTLVRIGGTILGANGASQVRVGGGAGDRPAGTASLFARNLYTSRASGEPASASDLVLDVPFRAPANNGGPTRTLLPNAYPHLHQGSPESCLDPLVAGSDQRGFPRAQGTPCDIGPLELTAVSPAIQVSGAGFSVGGPAGQSLLIQAAGLPNPTLTVTGALPRGLGKNVLPGGTVDIGGTPAVGTGGVYPLVLSAHNGVAPDASETYDLVVTEGPHITSPASATFSYGQAGTFTATSASYPTQAIPVQLVRSDGSPDAPVLPPGLTFSSGSDGTATLSGTPGPGSVGTYHYLLRAGTVSGAGEQAFTLVVAPRSATVTSVAKTITYGQASGPFTPAATGLLPGDTLDVPGTCTASDGLLTPGHYDVTCSGASDHDYVVSYATGSLDVDQRPISITANDGQVVYGETFTPSWSASGFVPGDPIDVPPSCTVGTDRPGVGTHDILCSGAADPHYQFNSYDPATLTVTPRPLSIVAHDASRAFGAPNPTFGWHLTGFASWDTQASAGITGTAACTTTATSTSPVAGGPYPIHCGPGSLSAPNYSFGGPSVPGRLTITKAATELKNTITRSLLGLRLELSTRLTRTGDGAPLAGRTVTFSVGMVHVCTATTDSDGRATCSFVGVVLGPRSWSTSWDGDANLLGDTTTTSL